VIVVTAPLTTIALHRGQHLAVLSAVGEVRVSEALSVRARPTMGKLTVAMPVAGIATSALAGFTSVNSS
jgi:hypothetical protein